MSINRIALICAALSLAGCAGFGQVSTSGLESVGPYPDNWESLVRDYIKTRFVDPYTIKDAMAAPPYRNRKAFYDTWTVCLRMNAKNRMGGYTGLQYYSLGIKKGSIDQVDINPRFDCRDSSLIFKPFYVN